MLNGKNFLMTMNGKEQKVGFFKNVFVEAADATAAEYAAVDVLRDDETLVNGVRNTVDDPPMLYATEIEEIESLRPPQGFIFFMADEKFDDASAAS